jgi:hypothetical protein
MTFKEITTRLMDYADVSSISHITQAKRAINDACMWANKKHMFKLAEGIVNLTYPANTLYVHMDAVCDKLMLVPITVQQVANATTWEGVSLHIMDYARIQMLKYKQRERKNPDTSDIYDEEQLYATTTTDTNEYKFFLLNGGFGLYPMPTTEVQLLIHFNEQLEELVNDDDTNFLLTYCSDFIITKALFSKFALYLPKDRLELMTSELLDTEWSAVLHWDKQIRNAENYFHTT